LAGSADDGERKAEAKRSKKSKKSKKKKKRSKSESRYSRTSKDDSDDDAVARMHALENSPDHKHENAIGKNH